jgi:cell division septation protein DedD
MEEKIKQRLIGVLVLIGSLFIILPFLFHNSRPSAEQEKMAAAVPNAATPPSVSVALPAENSATPSVNTASVNTTVPPTTTAANPNTATMTPPAATVNATATAPVSVTPATAASTAPQIQPAQSAPVVAKVTPPATPVAKTVVISSAKLNSNNIASTPDASGFKADQAVSPTSGLTTGVPISTPSTTEAMPSASADNQPVSTVQPTVANAQSATESVPTHTASHHKHAIKTAHHPHHAMHGKKWEIQLAVFSNEHNAKQLMAKLHAHHFAAHTHRVTHHGRHMIAVFVGPELNHHKTLALQNHLHREFHLSGVVKQV